VQLPVSARFARSLAIAISLTFGAGVAGAQQYNEVNLVSNQTSHGINTDVNLVNGCAFGAGISAPGGPQRDDGVSLPARRISAVPNGGKVSHLEGLRRKLPEEDDRRAGCGNTAIPVR
jgi:hypothetical protein